MRNVHELLREKEIALSRLRKEVAALRIAAPLLADDHLRPVMPAESDAGEVAEHVDGDNLRSKRSPSNGGKDVLGERVQRGIEVANSAVAGTARKISNRLKRMTTPLSSATGSVAQSS
jgi:hypothetical protein